MKAKDYIGALEQLLDWTSQNQDIDLCSCSVDVYCNPRVQIYNFDQFIEVAIEPILTTYDKSGWTTYSSTVNGVELVCCKNTRAGNGGSQA